MSANVCIIIAIVVYLGAMLYVGFAFSKNNSNAEDFYLGGRKMGPFVTAMSAEASDMSSWLLMGLPGVAYLSGHEFHQKQNNLFPHIRNYHH